MKKVRMVRQHDSADCGAACLLMISMYYGKKHSLRFIRKLTHTDQNGTTFSGIQNGAQALGIIAEGYSATTEEVVAYLRSEKKPVLVHFKKNHYVVACKAGKKILLADPGTGFLSMSMSEFSDNYSGFIMSFSNQGEDLHEDCPHYSEVYKGMLRSSWLELLAILLMSCLLITVSVGMSYLFEVLNAFYEMRIRRYVGKKENPFTYLLSNLAAKDIYVLFGFILLAILCAAGLLFLKGVVSAHLSKRLDIRFMNGYAHKLLCIRPGELNRRLFGDYISRLSDLVMVRRMFSDIPVSIFISVFLLIPGSILMIRISPLLYLLLFGTLVFYVILFVAVRNPIKAMTHSAMSAAGEFQTSFKETLQGSEAIWIYSLKERAHAELINRFSNMATKTCKANILDSLSASGGFLIEQIGSVMILFVGFEFVHAKMISLGEFVTFIMLLSLVGNSAKQLVIVLLELQSCQVSLERLEDIAGADEENREMGQSIERLDELKLENVCFSYFGSPILLKDVSLCVSGDKKLAIVGENGTGKSTLLKIIMGLEKDYSGHVFFGGIEAEKIKPDDLYKHIAYVPQAPFLFADTIRRNITFGDEYSEPEVLEACIAAGLDDDLLKTDQGLELFIDENGGNLSQGQKQSIVLARALIRKPDILILDEATCHMDAEKEKQVIERLFNLPIPCLFVTHNKAIADKVDMVYELRKTNEN